MEDSVKFVKTDPSVISIDTFDNLHQVRVIELVTGLSDADPSSELLTKIFGSLSLAASSGPERSVSLIVCE